MKLWTSIKNNKNKLIFWFTLFLVGIITGVLIYLKQDNTLKEAISIELDSLGEMIKNSRQNQIVFHTFVIVVLYLLSFTIIGYVGVVFYFFYEGCSFGFSLAILTFKYKMSGMLFGLLFNLLTKFIYWLLVLYVCFIGLKIVKKIIGSLVLKKDELTYLFLKRHFTILGIITIFAIVNETIIYFLTNKILNFFLFLL